MRPPARRKQVAGSGTVPRVKKPLTRRLLGTLKTMRSPSKLGATPSSVKEKGASVAL